MSMASMKIGHLVSECEVVEVREESLLEFRVDAANSLEVNDVLRKVTSILCAGHSTT